MLTEEHKALAKELSELISAVNHAIPGKEEERKEFLALISENISNIATQPPSADGPVKEIAENAIDVLEAIGNILPKVTDAKRQRQQRRFKAAVAVLKNFLAMFGLS